MKWIFTVLLLVVAIDVFAVEWCQMPDSSVGVPGLPQVDTVRSIVIWAVGAGYLVERVPTWYRKIWEIDTTFSMPHYYFKEHSDNTHIILVDVYGRKGLNDTLCFVSSIPFESTGCVPYDSYVVDIFRKADSVINYGLYAKGNDTIVDDVFFVSWTGGCTGSWAAWNTPYKSKDTNSQGDTVWVTLNHGICVSIQGCRDSTGALQYDSSAELMAKTVREAVHEYGHLLGLEHAFGSSGGCQALGPYNMMGLPPSNHWPPVMGPWERLHVGWVKPDTIIQTELDKPVRNYLRDNEIYQIESEHGAYPWWGEYFWVTHYFGKDYFAAKFWEGGFNGDGLLIWHYDEDGTDAFCATSFGHKTIDLELAHGLYIFDNTPPYDPPIPDPSAGKDSMDIITGRGADYSSPSFYWNFGTKTYFDKLSNPSSDAYASSGDYIQNKPTHVGISNIRGDGVAPETVDFIINNRVGSINTNDKDTIWNAGTYTINGDLTIDSNIALIIKPGAIVKITPNRDRMSAGVDVKKPEIIVKGRLKVEGTAANPVKFISFNSVPSDTDWYGIRVLPGGSAKLKYAQIKHAYIGISYENSAADTDSNCLFESNRVYGIKAWNNNLAIRNCTFKNMPNGWGIYAKDYSPTIENNYFDSLKYGVSAGRATITGNKFMGRSGISERAISCDNGNPSTATATSDTVVGTFSDAYLESYKSVVNITNCVLGDTTSASAPIGVKATVGGTAYVRNTNIYGYTSKGVYGMGEKIDLGNESGEADPGNNNIRTTASGTKAVWNTGSATLMAESNWWGQVPPPSSLFQGSVDYTPYLSSPGGPAKLLPTDIPITDNTPKSFSVSQNYPNPFNPTTVIEYSIPVTSRVSVRIYNILGQVVRTLVDENKLAGTYSVIWDGTNNSGKPVTSGVYFYLVKTDDFKETKKMTLIR